MEQSNSSLSKEIEAMAAIGRALGELTDPAARQRVLHWVNERFAAEVLQQPMAVAQASAVDADLTVDSLTDIFAAESEPLVDDTLTMEDEPVALVEIPKQPLESVLRSFAADFQRFADEWNGAAA